MYLPVDNGIYLSGVRASDKPACVEHLSQREIHETTLSIPHPYTETDADRWLALIAEDAAKEGPLLHFAIREPGDLLIGGCGFKDFEVGKTHRAEIGYWLAKPFWGRGIMTDVVRTMAHMAASELRLAKLTAHVFANNLASARVLEKNGFVQEGFLKMHHLKNGRYIDARLYGLILPSP